MPQFSQKSLDRLHTCHPLLQILMLGVVKRFDITVLCGHRGEAEQNAAYAAGNSKLKWPKSKHNKVPSEAVDIVPYPIDWEDTAAFERMGQVVLQCWEEMDPDDTAKWQLVWGKTFKGLVDYPHFEIRLRG